MFFSRPVAVPGGISVSAIRVNRLGTSANGTSKFLRIRREVFAILLLVYSNFTRSELDPRIVCHESSKCVHFGVPKKKEMDFASFFFFVLSRAIET